MQCCGYVRADNKRAHAIPRSVTELTAVQARIGYPQFKEQALPPTRAIVGSLTAVSPMLHNVSHSNVHLAIDHVVHYIVHHDIHTTTKATY